MVELMHAEMARRTVAIAEAIGGRHEALPLPDRTGRRQLLPSRDGGAEQGLAALWPADAHLRSGEAHVVCGQAITKEAPGEYQPGIKLSEQ